jgi:ribonuclease HI
MTHNWRKRSGGLPANLAYWQRLLRAVAKHETVVFSWTRGHVGTVGNETADKLAGKARLWREAAMVAV